MRTVARSALRAGAAQSLSVQGRTQRLRVTSCCAAATIGVGVADAGLRRPRSLRVTIRCVIYNDCYDHNGFDEGPGVGGGVSSTCAARRASRGLGLALAREWLHRGWHVVATVRGPARTPLHDLADADGQNLEIESVDVTEPEQVEALRRRLATRTFDLLFVNAGVTNRPEGTVAETSTAEFVRVMVTNALGPLRVIEALQDTVSPTGTIGVMSSGQGSVANNESGGHEVYRGSKAALNTFMRSYAARHRGEGRTLVLMAPGWVRTQLGGQEARLGIEESVPNVVATLDSLEGRPGLHYVDYLGRTVSW